MQRANSKARELSSGFPGRFLQPLTCIWMISRGFFFLRLLLKFFVCDAVTVQSFVGNGVTARRMDVLTRSLLTVLGGR